MMNRYADEPPPKQGIRVTVEDLATGEKQASEIQDDYVIVCAGSCHVDHIQAHGNGTHQLTIKGRKV